MAMTTCIAIKTATAVGGSPLITSHASGRNSARLIKIVSRP